MRVRGHSPVLWRRVGQSQIGTEPGHAVVLDGLSPQEQQLLDRLPPDLSPGDVYQVARWSEVPVARAHQILSALDEAGVLTRDAPAPGTGDEVYWERLADNPRARVRALRDGIVGIIGGCRLARALVPLLAETGVGTLLAEDEELGDWAGSLVPPVRTRMPLETRPHLVVTVEGHLVEPLRAQGLGAAEVAHLPVVVREVSVRVGPLLAPGHPPCATCLDLWERDADPQWPAVATQLRLLAPPQTELLLAHQAAALTARAVTDVLAGRRQLWVGRSVEVSGLEAVGVERLWSPHPECLCGALEPVAVPAEPGSPEARGGRRGRRRPATLSLDPQDPPHPGGPAPSPRPEGPEPRGARPPRTPGA